MFIADEDKAVGVEKKLIKKLREVWDDDDFVFGNRVHLRTDEERQAVIDAIDRGEVIGSDEVSLYALQIHQDREGR